MTLEFLEVTYDIMFSARQANYEIVTKIDNGAACNIALNLVNYDFTAPQTLAVGGRLRQCYITAVLQRRQIIPSG